MTVPYRYVHTACMCPVGVCAGRRPLVVGDIGADVSNNGGSRVGRVLAKQAHKKRPDPHDGNGCLPVHAGDRVKGLAVRMPLNK